MSRRLDGSSRFVALTVVVLFGAFLRVWGLGWGLHDATISSRPHPDEWVVYWLFHWFSQTGTLNPCPNAPKSCFFDWGAVFPYAAYTVHLLLEPAFSLVPANAFGTRADPEFVRAVLAGRVTSALLSTTTIVVVYATGRIVFDVEGGLLAALIMAASELPVQLAHFATPDSTVTFVVSLSLYTMVRAVAQRSAKLLMIAGIFMGLAAGAEYHMALLCLPLLVAWLLLPGGRLRFLLVPVALAVVTFWIANVYAILDWGSFAAAMRHTLLIRTVGSSAQYQGRFTGYGPDWLFIIRYPLGYGVGTFFTVWMALGVLRSIVRSSPPELVLLSWILAYGVVVSLSAAKFMRYSLPLMPALAIVAGGLGWWLLHPERRMVRGLTMVVIGLVTLYSIVYDTAYSNLFARADSRFLATGWLEVNVAPHSLLAFEQLPNGLVNLPYFTAGAGYRPCFTQFQARYARGPITYVLTDGYALEEHPRIPQSTVLRFRATLQNKSVYRVATRIHYEPSFMGLTFPIDGSPHDWRYPSRDITVYQRISPPASGSALCYRNVAAAVAALYPHQRKKV